MSPSGCSRTNATCVLVAMGGFEPPRGQALDLPPLPGLGYMAMVPPGGLEPPLHGLRARRAALTPRRGTGANDRIRTDTSRLGRPAGSRYPTFAIGSAYGYRTRPSTMAPWDAASTPRPNLCGPVTFTGLSTSSSCQRPRSFANTLIPLVLLVAGDSARIRTRTHEIWRLGCSPLHHTVVVNSIVR